MKKKTTWIIVADGVRARIFKHEARMLQSAVDIDFIQDHRPTHLATADKPGRGLESDHISKHTFEPETDWHERQKHLFAAEMARFLSASEATHAFQSLIIVAPPKTLGDLRKSLSKAVLEKIKQELPKDLTKMPENELASYLNKMI